jgi:heme oxygenase
MSPPSLRFFLRSATSTRHKALEEIVGPVETLSAYRRYLAGMHRFRTPIERALADADVRPALFHDWRPLELGSLLAEDAADLGLELASPAPAMAMSNDTAALAGLFYVLEGSSLGAQLTHRSVSQFGMTASHGARHLALQAGSLDNWRRYVALIEGAPTLDREAAAAAADDAFLAATQAFEQLDHDRFVTG